MFYKIHEELIREINSILFAFPLKDLTIGQISNINGTINRLGTAEKLPEEKPKEGIKVVTKE